MSDFLVLVTHCNGRSGWQRLYFGKMVNRALESASIASALSTALTIYLCQIRVHQRWQSKLQLLTARKKEWRPATVGSSPHAVTCQHCDTHYFSRPRTRNLPIVGWLLVRRATSSATDSPTKVGGTTKKSRKPAKSIFWGTRTYTYVYFTDILKHRLRVNSVFTIMVSKTVRKNTSHYLGAPE